MDESGKIRIMWEQVERPVINMDREVADTNREAMSEQLRLPILRQIALPSNLLAPHMSTTRTQ
jgi:hypothetical protein